LFPFILILIYIKYIKLLLEKMDVSNYLQENLAYNNLEDFQQQQQENFKQLIEQYKEGATNFIVPVIDVLHRAKGVYQAVKGTIGDVKAKVEEVANKGEEILGKGEDSSVIENDISSSLRNIGNKYSNKLTQNMFEMDPETSIADLGEGMNIIEKAQSMFRGGVSSISNVASNVGETVGETVGNIGETIGETVGKVAETAGENVAKVAGESVAKVGAELGVGEALGALAPVADVALIGVGIYDLVKAFRTHAPTVIAEASPALQLGI
jgi:hypothetical protein